MIPDHVPAGPFAAGTIIRAYATQTDGGRLLAQAAIPGELPNPDLLAEAMAALVVAVKPLPFLSSIPTLAIYDGGTGRLITTVTPA